MASPGLNTTLDQVITATRRKFSNGYQFQASLQSQLQALVGAATINRYTVIAIQQTMVDLRAAIETNWGGANSNGVTDEANAMIGGPAIDLEAEWATTKAAIDAMIEWVKTTINIETISIYSGWQANGAPAHINLTAGQLTAYKAQISAVLATIN